MSKRKSKAKRPTTTVATTTTFPQSTLPMSAFEASPSERPLHVMMDARDLERYKALAAERKMTLRDLVRSALEESWSSYRAEQTAARARDQDLAAAAAGFAGPRINLPNGGQLDPVTIQATAAAASALERRLLALTERMGRLEETLSQVTGGTLTAHVMERAYELADKAGDIEHWADNRHLWVRRAFDEAVAFYPEPLRTQLLGTRERFLASVLAPPQP